MKTRILSLALVLLMYLTLIPATAFASEPILITSVTINLREMDCNATLTDVYDRYSIGGTKKNLESFYFAPYGTVSFDKDVEVHFIVDAEFLMYNSKQIKAGEVVKLSDFSEYGSSFKVHYIVEDSPFYYSFYDLDSPFLAKDTKSNLYQDEEWSYGDQWSYNIKDRAVSTGNTPPAEQPSTWAAKEVSAAIATGLVPQNLQKDYSRPVSRGNVAQMFINLIEKCSSQNIDAFLAAKGVSTNENAFTDTTDKAVLAANALGIIQGVGNNRFDPNGIFTRAQISVIINRVARVLGVDTDGYTHSFTDVQGHWADPELGWPVHAEIIQGVGDNRFDPNGNLTTEAAILVTYRAFLSLTQVKTETVTASGMLWDWDTEKFTVFSDDSHKFEVKNARKQSVEKTPFYADAIPTVYCDAPTEIKLIEGNPDAIVVRKADGARSVEVSMIAPDSSRGDWAWNVVKGDGYLGGLVIKEGTSVLITQTGQYLVSNWYLGVESEYVFCLIID